jgi:aminoglycoside phosphotransferase (APT) family kinase protein
VEPRFRVTVREGPPPAIEKRGPAGPLAREAAALGIVAGRPWAPALLHHEPGLLVSARLPGSPRKLVLTSRGDLEALGAALADVHGLRRAAEGGLPDWAEPARDLAGYRRGRAGDAARALRGTPEEGLAEAAVGAGPGGADDDPVPFRLLHGDLVEANVVWGPAGPALVDWEFWRMGDPAEDLAYLVEVNGLPGPLEEAVLEGYGVPGMGTRIDPWRALVALDAGAWYRRHRDPALAEPLLRRARALLGA